jgi:hypothetical protein
MHRLSSALNRHQAERRSASSIHILRARTRLPDRIMGGIITPAQYADLETWSRADMPVPQQGPVSSARLHNRGSSHREFDGLSAPSATGIKAKLLELADSMPLAKMPATQEKMVRGFVRETIGTLLTNEPAH